jgi:hypothetical protein
MRIQLREANETKRLTPIAFGMTSMESVSRLLVLHARARVVFDRRRLERIRDREAARLKAFSDETSVVCRLSGI